MYSFDNYNYFLLVVDAFSSKVFVRPIKSKSAEVVKQAFEDIFKEFKAPIYVLQTDRGKEFLGKPCQKFFKENSIIYRSKIGRNKAFLGISSILNNTKQV